MKCAMCNGSLVTETGFVDFNSKSLGEIKIPNIKHKKCKICGDVLVDTEQSEKMVSYVREKEQESIKKIPIGSFISLNEAARILNVTKQAFSKNPKIKNGLIYSVVIDGRKLFDKKSVYEFKKTGNGKYRLTTVFSRVKAVDTWKTKFPKKDSFRIWSVNIGGTSRQYTIRHSERSAAYQKQKIVKIGKDKIVGFRDFI